MSVSVAVLQTGHHSLSRLSGPLFMRTSAEASSVVFVLHIRVSSGDLAIHRHLLQILHYSAHLRSIALPILHVDSQPIWRYPLHEVGFPSNVANN